MERALELYQKELDIWETLDQEIDSVDIRLNLYLCYGRMGNIYEELGRQINLERALEMFQKSLEVNEDVAQELDKDFAYDDLAVSYSQVAACLPKGSEERQRYLTQYLEQSEALFRKTQSRRYRNFIEKARQLLGETEQQ